MGPGWARLEGAIRVHPPVAPLPADGCQRGWVQCGSRARGLTSWALETAFGCRDMESYLT